MKRSKLTFGIAVALVLFCSGCSTFTFDSQGTFVGSSDFKGYAVVSEERVEGEACVNGYLFFISIGEASSAAAYAAAMKLAPEGSSGLSEVSIDIVERWFIVFHQKCIVLSGKPSRRT